MTRGISGPGRPCSIACRRRRSVQHVSKPAVQPGFARSIVVPRLDRLAEDVGVMASEPRDFLHKPLPRVFHQVVAAAVPQLVAIGQGALYARARGLERVLAGRLRVRRRQLPMPENHLRQIPHHRVFSPNPALRIIPEVRLSPARAAATFEYSTPARTAALPT